MLGYTIEIVQRKKMKEEKKERKKERCKESCIRISIVLAKYLSMRIAIFSSDATRSYATVIYSSRSLDTISISSYEKSFFFILERLNSKKMNPRIANY